MNNIGNLKPERVFYHFGEISKIPRESKNEKMISDYLVEWAKSMNLEVFQDQKYNVLIKKPASPGYENAPTVMLQGHMDMVCVKNSDIDHDFTKDPIQWVIKEDYLYANGTTLGADNGIGVAMSLAIAEDETLSHPALEILVTSDEETGMSGVMNLNKEAFEINSKMLINLDSEEEGIFVASCAGGETATFKVKKERVVSKYPHGIKIDLKGLSGGHSGMDITLEKGNANKLMGRLLNYLSVDFELGMVEGGAKDNAIPREAIAHINVADKEQLVNEIKTFESILKKEFEVSDPNVQIEYKETEPVSQVLSEKVKNQILSLIMLIPNGPFVRSTVIDLVVYSNNLGVIKIVDDEIHLICAARSSVESYLELFTNQSQVLASLTNCEVEISDMYPGWEYANESKIRDVLVEAYNDIYKEEATVAAIHAGLECGFLMEKLGELDAISMGPEMYDVHSPEEHLSISSTERTYHLLIELLKRLQ